jgi:hypothetical protein
MSIPDVLTQAAQGPTKGFTASDLLEQWSDLHIGMKIQQQSDEASQRTPNEDTATTPRRTQSMVDFSSGRNRRDKSLPPTIDEETRDEVTEQKETRQQTSPKRRVTECESLSDVQAYTLLSGADAVQEEIRS